ncbi:MAG: leucyl aminopeptidase [Proteobacteria bacterium]|nr:leucyl aminopeptidase [Pseudomonadota bacterium]
MIIKFKSKVGNVVTEKAEAILFPLFENSRELSGTIKQLDKASSGLIQSLLDSGDFKGERGKTSIIYTQGAISVKRIILVGLGKRDEFDLDRMRGSGGAAFEYARNLGIKKVFVPANLVEAEGVNSEEGLEAFLTGGALMIYQLDEFITNEKEKKNRIDECVVIVKNRKEAGKIKETIKRTAVISSAVYLARDLVSLPANKKTPSILANKARSIARKNKLKCRIITEAQARKMDMGVFLAVARGSREPAKVIVLEYHAGCDYGPPVVLIGKGITFDSGGISLKPAEKMERMKDDMAGGAAVMGAMQAAAQMEIPLNVIGIIPATENLPGGKAYKPGDILTSLSGQTIEVISTDAEGRLILADALTYAERFKPQCIVDLATLTGACIIALGDYIAGIMGNDDSLITKLKAAGEKTGEKVWQLPLAEKYFDYLRSDIADMKNVGERAAGTITAGLFLKKFVKDTPWVHLDIAGPAWFEKDKEYTPKGASGFGARLLIEFLRDWGI